MMLRGLLRQMFRKLRFQMIDDRELIMLPRIYRFASAQTVTFDDPNLVIQTGLNGVGIWKQRWKILS